MLRRLLARGGALGGAAALASHTLSRSENKPFFRLDDKVAMVTGASRGIGYAIACGLAEHGATVVMSGTNPESLAQARLALIRETNAEASRVTTVAFDVKDDAACVAAVREVARKTGRTPDILVNNAGLNHLSLIHI